MAVSKPISKQSKTFFLSLITLTLVGWFILFGWGLSLWGLSGFDSAKKTMTGLVWQQTKALAEFDSPMLSDYVITWPSSLAEYQLNKQIATTQEKLKQELNHLLPESNSEPDRIINDIKNSVIQIGTLIHLSTKLMLVKLTILTTAVPLFVLTSTAGLVDGLNQRAIRTASLGRESTYVFHQLNRYIKRGLFLLLALWLALPIHLQPALVFVPLSILLSVMVSMTASRFKKYL